tara:strand:+ start:855 stop:1112 length:258 start_codon:yes stop_codon:yes gene_type:complete
MASKKENKNRVTGLNRLLGFKGYKASRGKYVGKEFYLGGEYGRTYLGYRSVRTNKKISGNLTSGEMEEFLIGYRKGLTTKKSDFK